MKISWLRHIVLPLLLLTGLFILFDHLGWDLWCSDLFYFPQQGGWKYKHSWWAEQVLHKGGRNLIVSIAAVCLLVIAESFSSGSTLIRYRRAALYLILSIGLSTGTVAIGKSTINRHCPWDYERYDGLVVYTSIFSPQINSAVPQGHGFPAGHASGGFSLVALYFVFYGHRPFWAKVGLSIGLITGVIFTFAQLVRGAHFVSHSIFTLALCWLISVFLYNIVFKRNIFPASASKQKGIL